MVLRWTETLAQSRHGQLGWVLRVRSRVALFLALWDFAMKIGFLFHTDRLWEGGQLYS